jgi:hypothetical protein
VKAASMRAAAVITVLSLVVPHTEGALRFKLGLVAGYHPVDDASYQSIYGTGGFMYGVTAGIQFSKLIEARAEFDIFKDSGTMTTSGEGLSLTLKPQFVALRLTPWQAGRLRPFVGAGLGKVSIREEYPERISDYSSSTNLSLIEAGVYFRMMNHLDLAAELRWTNAKATSSAWEQDVDIGGFRPCLAITYTF